MLEVQLSIKIFMQNSKNILLPDPNNPKLTENVIGLDENGKNIKLSVVTEKPITIYLNSQEIVTTMTLGDMPSELAVGYLLNQNMLKTSDIITSIDYDNEIDEFIISGLNPMPCEKITPPRLQEAKISYECELNQIVEIGDDKAGSGFVVIGTIILFHIDQGIMIDGKINLQKLNPIGRLAGNWYTRPTDNFKIDRKIKPKK